MCDVKVLTRLLRCHANCSTQKMKALCSFQTLVTIYQFTRLNIPKDMFFNRVLVTGNSAVILKTYVWVYENTQNSPKNSFYMFKQQDTQCNMFYFP